MGPEARTILLVEDDPGDKRLLKRALEKAGVTRAIMGVADGDEAVAYLKGTEPYSDRIAYPRPGLMILDLKLPRRHGFEVLRWVRHPSSEFRRLPIVILSSSCEPADVARAYDLGANSYLCKPDKAAEWIEMAKAFTTYWLEANQDPGPMAKSRNM